jgi:hypothetical protein
VTVRLRAFEGILWVSVLVATAIGLVVNAGIHWSSGGEGIKTDRISRPWRGFWRSVAELRTAIRR